MFDLQAMHTHELQLDLGIKEYRLTDLQAMHTHELQPTISAHSSSQLVLQAMHTHELQHGQLFTLVFVLDPSSHAYA